MFPVEPHSLRSVVVSEGGFSETLSQWGDETDPSLDVETISPERAVDQGLSDRELDCLVVDCSAPSLDSRALVEQCADERPTTPVILLVDDWDDRLGDALAAGATATLPRRLVETDPEQLADRIASTVEREHARTSVEELYDNVAGLVTLHDPESGSMVHANRSLCDHLGYDRADLLSMEIGDFTADVPGYDHERAMNVVGSVTDRGEPIEVEWPLTTADGTVRWVEASLRPVRIGGRELVLSTSVDITDRRRQERKYEQVFDNVNDVITVHDPWDGALVDVNERFCELTGYSRDALLAMGVDGFSATDEGYTGDRAYDIQRTVAATGEAETVDWVVETADGERRRLETVLSPTTIAGDDRVLVLGRDVTERRRLEETYRDLFESVSDGLVVHDPETGEIRDVNERYCELTGYDREELVGANVRLIVSEHSEDSYEDAIERIEAAREHGPQLFEFEGQRKDGSTFAGEIHLRTVDVRGEERVLASVRDVTERKRREREYEQIFDGVNDAIVIQDPETAEPIDANQTFLDRLGYDDVDEIRQHGFNEFSATDAGYTKERAQELCRRVMESGEPETVEWQQETKDGDRRWIEAKVDSAVIQGHERIVSMQRDITERKRREREYEQIFDGVQDGILIFDPETLAILDANETYLDMLGYETLESLQRQGVEGLTSDADEYTVEKGAEVHRRVAETGDPEVVDWEAETKAGERRWLEVKVAPAVIGGEEVTVAINRDITERKRREREYEQIFNAVNDIINVYDPETGDLVDVNETMCELTGYDRETLLERGLGAVSATDEGFTGDRAERIIEDVMTSGEPRTLEWQLETADGDRIWLDVKAAPATIGGADRLLTISRDVTERRRTERRLDEILDRIDEAIFMTRAEEITSASQSPDYVSSGYEAIWGQSLDEIRDTYEDGFFGTLHPDDASEYRAFVEGVVDDVAAGTATDSYSHEYRIERSDGEGRWIHSDYYPTTWNSGPARVVIVSRDVTDRKARERRIASFDDATDDLATADTAEEATRLAVDAATETLDLPAVGTFLYDRDEGVLHPEVLTGPLPDAVAADPIGPGDGPLWEGFATGTIVASDGGQRPQGFVGEDDETPVALADLEEWRALALGNHGVLLVGTPDRTLDPETIQRAHILAATLEAALNHLQGQQRLAAQEAELRTQTRRAERLDRIARLTQQVEAAITDASNPGEIERAVCERLASAGPYDLAWVGGLEVGSDRLTARVVVGAPDHYVEGMQLTTAGDTADPHPALVAWQRDDVQVADSIVSDGPADDWRRHVLSGGYQSLCAVPLTYNGVTHGVLTVGTDSPNSFGERERDVLAQLGTSIANALAAIERRRALESDETVELEFRGDGDGLSFARAAAETGCRVAHERTVARQDGPVSVYFSFEGDVPDDAPDVARRVLSGSVDVVTDEATLLVEVQTDEWFGSPLAEYGGVLREAVADPDGTKIAVEVPRQADVRSFADRLQSVAPSLDLTARRQHRREDRTPAELNDRLREELTERQFEVLQTALSAGYFEWPRENDGSAVADRLDITQPTLNKHLRLAEKQIFTLLLDADE